MNNKIDKEMEITIPLRNFKYSGSLDQNPKFLGRSYEKKRLLDHLTCEKNQSGSFLIAGYRGVGKTSFVNEVLKQYRDEKGEFIEVRINLGNERDLSSKTALFNMIYILHTELRKTKSFKIWRFLFGNALRSLAITIITIFSILLTYLACTNLEHVIDFISTYYRPFFTLFPFLVPLWLSTHYGKLPFFSENLNACLLYTSPSPRD